MYRQHVAALALALTFGGLAHAGSSTRPSGAADAGKASATGAAKLSVLYDQSGGKITGGIGVLSVDQPAVYVGYDTQAADDFTVPAGATWLLTQVEVFGYTQFVPPVSHNITVYKSQNGLPGKVVADFPALVGVDTDGGGSYKISLPSKLKLGAGVYWLSVQANSDPAGGTTWYWQYQATGWGQPAVWRNPGEGYGAGCGSYTPTVDCYGFAMDLRFVLRGTVK